MLNQYFRRLVIISSVFVSVISVAQETSPFDGLPADTGQVEVFAFCSACHSMMIVKQQNLSREDWEETLEWMVEEQGMDEMPADIRPIVLDYLAKHYGEK